MQDKTTMTHGINMDALGRSEAEKCLDDEQISIEAKGLNLFYGD